jgi:hypothetical protein
MLVDGVGGATKNNSGTAAVSPLKLGGSLTLRASTGIVKIGAKMELGL